MVFKMERTEERRRFLRRGFNTYLATCFTGGVMGTSCIETHKSKAHGTFDGESTSFQSQFPAMGSLLKVLWEDEGATRSEVLERAQKIDLGARQVAEHWNSVLSDYDDDSESSRVTSAADDLEWHNVSSDFTAILNEADHWYQLSEGAFDVALGAMTRLRRRRRIPSQEVWAKAKDQVGWHHVDWDRVQSRLRLKRSGVRFDFGAIGKGWVADRIYDLLIATGIQRCLVNFAGNMRVGLPPRGNLVGPFRSMQSSKAIPSEVRMNWYAFPCHNVAYQRREIVGNACRMQAAKPVERKQATFWTRASGWAFQPLRALPSSQTTLRERTLHLQQAACI